MARRFLDAALAAFGIWLETPSSCALDDGLDARTEPMGLIEEGKTS
jgi:hypothetical protein